MQNAQRKKTWPWVIAAIVVVAVGGAVWWGRQGPAREMAFAGPATATAPADRVSYDGYAAVLTAYVDDKGMVAYKKLKADRKTLDAFAATLGVIDRKGFEARPKAEKIAFWINAYNALTLEAIIANYPIKSSLLRSVAYPKNSIRQIPGVWDKVTFSVTGRKMTLNDIEHNVLRKQFNEPRIHMALVCAAMGCPPLRNEPYVGKKLASQLDDQSRRFLNHPDKFHIDRKKSRVALSSIFKWFGGDFVKTYGTDEHFKGHNPNERAVLNFISKYVSDNDRTYLREGAYTIAYFDYDWTLNE